MNIQNIYCVGRNYHLHAEELGNELPTSPLVFTKPTHALTAMKQTNISIPYDQGEVHYELELVLRIGEGYKSGMTAEEAVDAITLGLDLTLRDVQEKLKAKGLPWLPSKGFKQSAGLGEWLPFPGTEEINLARFELKRNGQSAQIGYPKDMIFQLDELVTFIDTHYGLGTGDIIFTGTPAGVAQLHSGDELQAYWNEQMLGACKIM